MLTITANVLRVHRHGHTIYGNPIMSVDLADNDNGEFYRLRISDNASLVYEIDNPEFKESAHTFVLTRAGRISHRLHDAKAA